MQSITGIIAAAGIRTKHQRAAFGEPTLGRPLHVLPVKCQHSQKQLSILKHHLQMAEATKPESRCSAGFAANSPEGRKRQSYRMGWPRS